MTTYLDIESIPFWTPEQIATRRRITTTVLDFIVPALRGINKAWKFYEIDGPLLTPKGTLSGEYDASDVFITQVQKANETIVLRPETTPSSYEWARQNLRSKKQYPACVWQAGKSFRVEATDGARASTLRFNEFYQMEFQCIYAADTKADYRSVTTKALRHALERSVGGTSRLVESDRLPSYSTLTMDVEMTWKNEFKEVASISTRTDYSDDYVVLEVALGLDRAVMIAEERKLRMNELLS